MEMVLKCDKCKNELEFCNTDAFYGDFVFEVKLCENCSSTVVKEEHMMLLNFLDKNDIVYSDSASVETGLELLTKELGYLDSLEETINKIIPEYRNVPLEYKILLFKERVNQTYIVTKKYSLNELQINVLSGDLTKKLRFNFVKHIRQFLDIGLKDAKHMTDETIPYDEFNKEYSFEEAKKLIIERF